MRIIRTRAFSSLANLKGMLTSNLQTWGDDAFEAAVKQGISAIKHTRHQLKVANMSSSTITVSLNTPVFSLTITNPSDS